MGFNGATSTVFFSVQICNRTHCLVFQTVQRRVIIAMLELKDTTQHKTHLQGAV